MNYPDSGTVTTPGKSTRFSSAARALVLGLALVLPGAAALAINDPIPGVDIIVKKNPSGIAVSAATGADGVYQFKGLAPGNYDLFVGGQRVQTINVGANRSISGVLSSDGGKASITFNGQVGVVPDLPSAPVNTTRSNKKAGIAKGEVPPPNDVLPSAPVSTSRSNKKAGIAKGKEPPPDDVLPSAPVSTSRSNKKAGIAKGEVPPPDDVLPSAIVTTRSNIKRPGKAVVDDAAPDNGQVGVVPDLPSAIVTTRSNIKRPGKAVVGDAAPGPQGVAAEDSGTSALGALSTTRGKVEKPVAPDGGNPSLPDTQDPIPGVDIVVRKLPHTSGKITDNESPKPTDRGIRVEVGDVNGDGRTEMRTATSSKAGDIYGQPVIFTASKAAPLPDGGDVKPGISDQGTVGGLISYGTAPPPKDGGGKLPGIAGDPVPGTSVGLDHDPGGPISTTKTGPDGAYQFTGLPAGKYKLTFPGLPAKSITIGTDGKTGGKVLRDGNNVIVTGDFEGSPARSQATANPVPGFPGGGFPGIGNVMGGILPGMSPGAGGPAGPMGPGAGAIRR